jgi:transposase
MNRKAIAIEAYLAGYSSREAARIAGMSSSYVREMAQALGVSRPVGRPRKHLVTP